MADETPDLSDVSDLGEAVQIEAVTDLGERTRNRRSSNKEKSGGEKPPKINPDKRATNLQKSLENMYAGLALVVAPFDFVWSQEIAVNGSRCAEAWDNLAKENDAVRKMLERLLTASSVSMVVGAHVPILLAAPGVRDRFAELMQRMAEQPSDAESA